MGIIVNFIQGAIAQLGERNTGSVEVGGSIPPSSTINLNVEFSIEFSHFYYCNHLNREN